MNTIALYVAGRRYVLEDSGQILSRANQALATLERYKMRLDEVSGTLSALEIEDLVTVRDVAAVAQRLEMVRRISAEIADYLVELGTDGRLLSLQLDELIAGVEADRELVIRDYQPAHGQEADAHLEHALADLDALVGHRAARPRSPSPGRSASRPSPELLDSAVSPRGFRLLARVPRLPERRASSASSTTSAACSGCSPRASTTCRPSRASARPRARIDPRGPVAASPSRASSSATSDRTATRRGERVPRRGPRAAGRRVSPARIAA